jgi:hypothetical protein
MVFVCPVCCVPIGIRRRGVREVTFRPRPFRHLCYGGAVRVVVLCAFCLDQKFWKDCWYLPAPCLVVGHSGGRLWGIWGLVVVLMLTLRCMWLVG